MLRARSPHGVFHGRPPFDRQPARLSDRGPPQPAPELCGSRRYSEGPGLSVVGGATPGRDTGKRSDMVAKKGLGVIGAHTDVIQIAPALGRAAHPMGAASGRPGPTGRPARVLPDSLRIGTANFNFNVPDGCGPGSGRKTGPELLGTCQNTARRLREAGPNTGIRLIPESSAESARCSRAFTSICTVQSLTSVVGPRHLPLGRVSGPNQSIIQRRWLL